MSSPFTTVCPACGAANRVSDRRPAGEAVCGACRAHLFTGKPLDVDEQELQAHLRRDLPVLLDIWAPWCAPCRAMAPAFAQAARVLEPRLRLLKLNADAAPQTVARLGVRGIPALILFRGGGLVARSAGARDAAGIVAWAEANIRNPVQETIA